jgi:phospholipid transport system substrate-binding protein
MMKIMTHTTGLLALLFALGAPAQQGAPDALVKNAVNDVLGVIKQNRDQSTLIDLAEKKVVAHFDFRQMTQLALGRSWSQATPAQQDALERAFRTLLVRTYTAALSQSSGETRVEVKPAVLKAGDVETVVRTLAYEPGRKPVQIDYRMRNASGGWKVYDVVVENLSLVTNYRSSFQSEVARSGIDGLIRTIEAKNQKREG